MSSVLLVCHVNAEIGIGHLSRLLALAETLRKDNNVIPEFLIFGDFIKKNELADFNLHAFSLSDNFVTSVERVMEAENFNAVVFDLYTKQDINNLDEFFLRLKECNIYLVGIDSLIEYCNILDLIWIPSFNFDCSKYSNCTSVIKSGWDSFLIQKRLPSKKWSPGLKVLILTGGSDVAKLSRTLPVQLNESLGKNVELHWVRGPFSEPPILPDECRLEWHVHDAPTQLDELIVHSDYVLTVFGVSLFEVLQYGIPSVVFSPYGDKDDIELTSLSEEKVALVSDNAQSAVDNLIKLMNNDKLAREYSTNALNKLSVNGAQKLSEEIYSLIGV